MNNSVHVRLPEKEREELDRVAKSKGLTHTQLARSYILLGLRREEGGEKDDQ